MPSGGLRYYIFAALVFISGSVLVFLGATQSSFPSQYTCFGGTFFSCPNYHFDLLFLILGTVFVFLAYPITKLRSGDAEASLIWNKKISGISLIVTGTVITVFSLVAFLYIPVFTCPVLYGCPTIFDFVDNWIQVFYGVSLILVGLILLALDRRKQKELFEDQKANEALQT